VRACAVADGSFLRFVDISGTGPARVYLHGLARSSIGALAHIATHPALTGRRSLLVDLLGFGFSDRPEAFGYRVEDHAATIITLLDGLGLRRCELIGHSMGGVVAILVASERPDLVSAVVVAEANLDPGGGVLSAAISAQTEDEYVTRGYGQDVERVAGQARETPDGLAPIILGMLRAAAPYAIHRGARSLAEGTSPSARQRLRDLSMPRAFLVGERTPPSVENPPFDDLAAAGVRRIVVPNTGHPMMFQQPDGFARVIAEALDMETSGT
jgi:pimeloyl-ACP methyl ester carboxylesterase